MAKLALGSVMAAAALSLGACNIGRQNDATVTVSMPLLDCQTLAANAGRSVQTTFIAVAGAEFPPITEFRNEGPCLGESPSADEATLATFNVNIPEGDNRALAIAVLGTPIDIGTATLPDVSIRGVPLRTTTPRPVFFGGGMILKRATLEGPEPRVNMQLEPFVNMLGRIQAAGAPAAAKLTFYAPDMASDGCLATFEDARTTSFSKLYEIDVGSQGAYLASVPYRATNVETPFGAVCDNDEAHGNELFAVAEGAGGRSALFVPGRALGPGRGLEPGMLLRNSVIYLRSPDETGDLVTSATLVTTTQTVELYLSIYAESIEAGPNITFAVRRANEQETTNIPFSVKLFSALGSGTGRTARKLESYRFLHRFGTRMPFVVRLVTEHGFAPGEYVLTLPDGQAEFPFRIQ